LSTSSATTAKQRSDAVYLASNNDFAVVFVAGYSRSLPTNAADY